MTITKRLIDVNYSPTRQGNVVDHIIIHTMDGALAGTYDVFSNPAMARSAHYGVGLDGSLVQYVSEGDTAWHAGDWPMNLRSVGVEHEDGGNYNDSVRTNEQYETSAQLVADLCRRYSIPVDRYHIKKHTEVADKFTQCPDGLDIDRIVARAAEIVSQIVTATAPATHPYPVTDLSETVKVTLSVLQVRTGPGTSFPGNQANTPDGLAHAGLLVQIIGYTHGESATVGATTSDVWLKTLNALGQSHWIWAKGTNFVEPAPAPEPAPEPQAEPAPVEAPVETPAPEPVTEPAPTPVQQTTPEPATLALDHLEVPGTAKLTQTGIVTDLATGKPLAQVPAGVERPIVATVSVDGELYLVTQNMAAQWDTAQHGIAARYFKTPRPVDGLSKVPVAGESITSTLPVHHTVELADLGRIARLVAKALHLIK